MIDTKKELEQWGPIDGVILYPSIFFNLFTKEFYERWGVRWSKIWGFYHDDKMVFYWYKNDLEKQGKKAIEGWLLNEKNFRKLKGEYQESENKLRIIARQLDSDFRQNDRGGKADSSKLRKLALAWHEEYFNFFSIASVFEVANYGAVEYLGNLLRHVLPHEAIDEALEIFLAPEYLSFHQQSIFELLRTHDLEKYARKWYWVENSYFESKILTARDFRKHLDILKKKNIKKLLIEIRNYPKEIERRKQELAKRYKIPKKILDIAEKLSYSIWLQDHRKGLVWWADSVLDHFNKYAPKDILCYSEKEWLDFFAFGKRLSKSEVAARKKFCFIDFNSRGYSVITGEKAEKLAAKYEEAFTVIGEEIRGLVVSRSKRSVRGRVRILKSTRNIGVFKKGDILVAPMTSPDYIVAMRKAKAIITDVGGLMSHAAVVSRELGVPCIVGTKIATKVLKDGDLVQVDAEKGIVKILKKAG